MRASVSEIATHSAKLTARIDPEGGRTEYAIWIDPGCYEGACERAGPYRAKAGEIKGDRATASVSVTVHNLPEGVPNNEFWVVATNAAGTTKTRIRSFRTQGKHPEF